MKYSQSAIRNFAAVIGAALIIGLIWYTAYSQKRSEQSLDEVAVGIIAVQDDLSLQLLVPETWLPFEKSDTDIATVVRGRFKGCFRTDQIYLFGSNTSKTSTICPTFHAYLTRQWAAVDDPEEGAWYEGWTKEEKQADLAILAKIYRQESLAGIDIRQNTMTDLNPRILVGPIWGNGAATTDRFLPQYIHTEDNIFRGVSFIQNETQDYSIIPTYRVLVYNPETSLVVDIQMPVNMYEPFLSDGKAMEEKLARAQVEVYKTLDYGEEVDANEAYKIIVEDHYPILDTIDASHNSPAGMVMQAINRMASSVFITHTQLP